LTLLVLFATSTPAHAGATYGCEFGFPTFTAHLNIHAHSDGSFTTSAYLTGVHPGVSISETSSSITPDKSAAWDFYGNVNATITFSVAGVEVATDDISCRVTKDGDIQTVW
ncbi:MAG: hypothetical protein AAGF95_33715, partial [Chloroflexota bacterium]